MFYIKMARMIFGKFHPQQAQNKANINIKVKHANHTILEIALASCFIHICFGI